MADQPTPAAGVILSEAQWARVEAVLRAVEADRGGPFIPPARRANRGPGQFPPDRWARLTAKTVGPPDSFDWTEIEYLAAGTWVDIPAADNPATSVKFGAAYEVNGNAVGDPTAKNIYVRLYPVWNSAGKVFEYRFIWTGLPTANYQYDVITANAALEWEAGDVRAKPS